MIGIQSNNIGYLLISRSKMNGEINICVVRSWFNVRVLRSDRSFDTPGSPQLAILPFKWGKFTLITIFRILLLAISVVAFL